jgi:hypothetical protein
MELERYAKRAKRKGIPYDLTMDWLKDEMDKGICAATGLKFKLQPNISTINPFLPSIDRIDSSKGYTKNNCQVVILGYNNLKSDNTIEEVVQFCKGYIKYYEQTCPEEHNETR